MGFIPNSGYVAHLIVFSFRLMKEIKVWMQDCEQGANPRTYKVKSS
jgi:hypothetical protein